MGQRRQMQLRAEHEARVAAQRARDDYALRLRLIAGAQVINPRPIILGTGGAS